MMKLAGLVMFFLLAGCATDNVLSTAELEKQAKADAVVASVLFDQEVDANTSYNVRKNGFVVMKFDNTVSAEKYITVVDLLRSNADVNGVRAEQSGKEVCQLRR